jgi:hypothetical protein
VKIINRFLEDVRSRLLHRLTELGADGVVIVTFERKTNGIQLEMHVTAHVRKADVPTLLRKAADRLEADLVSDPCAAPARRQVH